MNGAADIQGLVEALATELGRPVELDDHRFRSLAYSTHLNQVDEVRMASILRREAPPEVVAWLESLGIRDLEHYARVGANEGLGMAARVCVPVRFDNTLLGFLWLIDQPTALSEHQLEQATRYAGEIGVALYRQRILDQGDRERERTLLAQLLGVPREGREQAAAELIGAGHMAAAGCYLAVVLGATCKDGEQISDPVRVRLLDSAERLRRTVAPRHALVHAGFDEVVTLLALEPGQAAALPDRLATFASEAISELPGWQVRVGVGERTDSADGLTASYRQAQLAMKVSGALRDSRPVARWAELGAYQVIAPLVCEQPATFDAPQPLQRLLADDDANTLLHTVECYLDCGGDVKSAASALYIHRSSLYDRLRRIEHIAGIDIHSGEARLQLHVGIRICRLEGKLRHPPGPT